MPSIAPSDTTDIRRNHERRGQDAETLLRDAALLLDVAGVFRSSSWLARTVRAYLASPVQLPFGLYLAAKVEMNAVQRRRVAEHEDLRYLLSYADPTGEQAVRNVMREQMRTR